MASAELTALRDRRAELAANLANVEAEIFLMEARRDAKGNARRASAAAAVARCRLYRDGTPRNLPGHVDIARRYAWESKHGALSLSIDPGCTGSAKLMTILRLCELERVFHYRYGGALPDDDAGRDDLVIVAHHIAHLDDAAARILSWARLWASWMPADELQRMIADVTARPRKFRADTLGWRLRLSSADRRALGLKTIGAFDQMTAQRALRRKIQRRAREHVRRRQRGAQPRADYEASSITRGRPWEALGISRRTWYRRKRKSSAGELADTATLPILPDRSEPPSNQDVRATEILPQSGSPGGFSGQKAGSNRAKCAGTSPWPVEVLDMRDGDMCHPTAGGSPRIGHARRPAPRSPTRDPPGGERPGREPFLRGASHAAEWKRVRAAALRRDPTHPWYTGGKR
jgi:hypothetical protein